jgi:hypothetical protein
MPTGRALLRRLSAATVRGPDPLLTALAAPPRLHPSRRGDTAGTRLYSAPKPIKIEDPPWKRRRVDILHHGDLNS